MKNTYCTVIHTQRATVITVSAQKVGDVKVKKRRKNIADVRTLYHRVTQYGDEHFNMWRDSSCSPLMCNHCSLRVESYLYNYRTICVACSKLTGYSNYYMFCVHVNRQQIVQIETHTQRARDEIVEKDCCLQVCMGRCAASRRILHCYLTAGNN